MQISDDGLAFIEEAEGFAPLLTQDAGYPMIGYGCDLTDEEAKTYVGVTLTPEAGELLLKARLVNVCRAVTNLVKVPLTQPQFDALVSFAYNVGLHAFAESTLLAYLNRGQYAAAALQFSRWHYSGGRMVAGLSARREAERDLFLKG